MSTYSEKLRDPRWQKKRLEILERDKWTCQGCGDTSKELQVHHTVYENGKKPWEHDSDGLRTLCVDCHGYATESVKKFREAMAFVPPKEALKIASFLLLASSHVRACEDDILARQVMRLGAKLENDIGIVRYAVQRGSIDPQTADEIERDIFRVAYP